ncbi:TonB-dependent receptor [Nguyenibacter vanlangensis]|uniref:TonB-dependent receptor n=1 Tax=Nguyenibacter vanlangensis TaxID=1216886 RepID=A0ABZ3DA93_9PROT
MIITKTRFRLLCGVCVLVAMGGGGAHAASDAPTHKPARGKTVVARKVPVPSPRVERDARIATATRPATSRTMAIPSSQPAAPVEAEAVVVTGSYLGVARNSDPNPVQTVKAADIQNTSATTIGDYLLRLPSIGSTGTSNAKSIAGNGLSCVDLRNLGQSRVLVLVDGKRMVQTMGASTSCVDLNAIATDQIASVEILKDGGSELYGADAVSGVVNIKLRHDVNDAAISVRGGITDVGDDRTGRISAHKGFNFDHDRGNISFFGQYMTQGGTYQRDRSWSRDASSNNPAPGAAAIFGSSITSRTRVDPAGMNLISNNNGTFSKYNSSDNYNYGMDQTMVGYTQSSNLNGDFHYDINRHMTIYSQVNYAHRTTSGITGLGVPGSGNPESTLLSSLTLPAGNPYNIWGENVGLYKRFAELGPRELSAAVDTYQVTSGARGQIFGDWHYDASMAYGSSQSAFQTTNDINYAHLLQELGVEQLNPGSSSGPIIYNPSVCAGSAGCQLVNPFVPWSGQGAHYISYTQHSSASYQLRDFNLRIHNNNLVKLPYQNGGNVGLAFGMEHRGEQGSFHPDPLIAAGQIAGESAAPTGGGFNANEVYGELRVPLLQNAAFAKDLTVGAQGRWSSYNTFGSTQNWKSSINWAPTRDIRFRATLGTSYRQPSIYELYGGNTLALTSAIDPCSQARTYGGLSSAVVQNCAKAGVDANHFTSAWSGQLPVLSGGNKALKPEQGRTYTFGTVITPRILPGLNISVEYWHYTIKNAISTVNPQYILDQCYEGLNTAYCSDVAPRSSSGQITQVSSVYQNLGGVRTGGIDFDLSYPIRLTMDDTVVISNNMQEIISYQQQNSPGGPWLNYNGRMIYSAGYGFPRVKDYFAANWYHGNFRASYMMNFTGGMVLNNGTTDLTAKTNTVYRVSPITSHDVTVGYDFGKWHLDGGVNNLFNKAPPYIPTAVYNTASGLYGEEMIGRYVWLQAGVAF